MKSIPYQCSIIADAESQTWEFSKDVFKYLQEMERELKSEERERFIQRIGPLLEDRFQGESLSDKRYFTEVMYDSLNNDESMFELNEMNIKRFRDGEIRPKIKSNIRRSNCFFMHDSKSEPLYWYTCLGLVNHALRNSSAHEIVNVLPYHRFSRQDVKDESRVPISAQHVANSIDFDHTRVLTMDIHNPTIQGFYKTATFDSLHSFRTVTNYISEKHPDIDPKNTVIGTPDEGGVKRARKLSKWMGARGIAMVDKYRLVPGELGGSEGMLGNVDGFDVLFVDDLIDSGSSAIQASRIARDNGAKRVFMYATHGLFSEGYEKVLSNFNKFFIGNTIAQPDYPGLEVIRFEKLFAEAIHIINIGDSLSRLFEKK